MAIGQAAHLFTLTWCACWLGSTPGRLPHVSLFGVLFHSLLRFSLSCFRCSSCSTQHVWVWTESFPSYAGFSFPFHFSFFFFSYAHFLASLRLSLFVFARFTVPLRVSWYGPSPLSLAGVFFTLASPMVGRGVHLFLFYVYNSSGNSKERGSF